MKSKAIDNMYKRYERSRKKSVEVSIGFTQGFVCAVCVLIQFYGCVTTEVKELWSAGGLHKIEDMDNYNIDVHDREILIKYQSELFNHNRP